MKRGILTLIGVTCIGAVGAAYFTQHHWGMEPCPWCVLQRIIFLAMGAACLTGAAIQNRWASIGASTLTIPLSLSGAASALYQHFVAAKSSSCNLTFADKVITALKLDTLWPDMFEVRASCADAAVNLVGLPYEFWSLMLFAISLIAAIWVLRPER